MGALCTYAGAASVFFVGHFVHVGFSRSSLKSRYGCIPPTFACCPKGRGIQRCSDERPLYVRLCFPPSTAVPDFRQWLQEQLGEKRVQKVEVSKRLVGSAATLVQSSYGMSPTMARYMRAQAVAFGEQDSTMTGSQQVQQYSSSAWKCFGSTRLTHVLVFDVVILPALARVRYFFGREGVNGEY